MRKSRRNLKIQTRLILIFLFTTAIIFGINLYLYMNINRMIVRIDKIYASNADLNVLQQALSQVHGNMTEYLNTKSSDSLEDYYRSEQAYSNLCGGLNERTVGNASKVMEKNIGHMSEAYLALANKAVEAKRGRNVEKYKVLYEEAVTMFDYLDTTIYSLNNRQFRNNSGNYEMLLASLKYSEAINIIVLCIAGLLNTTLIIMLTRSITRPLKQLADAAGQVAAGRLDIELAKSAGQDEIGVVTDAFNQMVASIQLYIKKLKESMEMESAMKEKELLMEAHLKDAQLRYLQAQINPHFLFNTLNAGAQLAMLEEADRTYRYIQNTAEFFRYNMKKNLDSVTLSEEILLVDSYIYILNVRFSGEIHFKKMVDESLIHIRVPGMILQPIVENSVNYGIRGIDWEGVIELSVNRDKDHICVSIRDNGIGIGKEKIDRIISGRLDESEIGRESNGIGLDNVISRLRLFYGTEDVMEIISEGENQGTKVNLYIPYEERKEG